MVVTIPAVLQLQVLSPDDVAFRLNREEDFDHELDHEDEDIQKRLVCVTLTNTSGLLFIAFLCVIVVAMVISVFACLRKRKRSSKSKAKNKAVQLSKEDLEIIEKERMKIRLKDPRELKAANENLKTQIQHRKNLSSTQPQQKK